MTIEEFRHLALSFQGTIENPHFDRISFKIVNKRIFATMHEKTVTVNLKFSTVDQAIFCSYDQNSIYPVANRWGTQGWTTFEVKNIPRELMLDALSTAYKEAINAKLRKI